MYAHLKAPYMPCVKTIRGNIRERRCQNPQASGSAAGSVSVLGQVQVHFADTLLYSRIELYIKI